MRTSAELGPEIQKFLTELNVLEAVKSALPGVMVSQGSSEGNSKSSGV